jgi:hypothetical protein
MTHIEERGVDRSVRAQEAHGIDDPEADPIGALRAQQIDVIPAIHGLTGVTAKTVVRRPTLNPQLK